MVGENEHDCLRENNVIYYFEVKSHLGRYGLLLGQHESISFNIKARKTDLYCVSIFGIVGCIKVYKVKGVHE